MRPIQAPIKQGEAGPKVANLQDALLLLMDRGAIRDLDPNMGAALARGLADERSRSVYGQASERLVGILKAQEGLGDGLAGIVESNTADLVNRLLKELGVLDMRRGFVRTVRAPLKYQETGEAVVNLQDGLSLLLERGVIPAPSELNEVQEAIDSERAQQLFGRTTRGVVQRFQETYEARFNVATSGVVDEPTAAALNALLKEQSVLDGPADVFLVRGRITHGDGEPFAGTLVRAFDRDMRTEELLGDATTDRDGRYEIRYSSAQFGRAETGGADLVVSVCNERGLELVRSGILFNAGAEAVVDLVVPWEVEGRSEYERLLAVVTPLLQDVAVAELTDEDVAFLAGGTGEDQQRIVWIRESARRALEGSAGGSMRPKPAFPAQADAIPSIPAAVYYGWFREGIPTEPTVLWSRSTAELMAALEKAIAERVVPAVPDDQVDGLAQMIEDHGLDQRLRPAPSGARPSLGDLLATLPTPLEARETRNAAAIVTTVSVDDQQFRKRLGEAGLTVAQAVGVERTVRLGLLTEDHAPLMSELQQRSADDGDASLRSLAAITRDQWFDLAYAHGTPAGVNIATHDYATYLFQRIEELHPTAALAARLDDSSVAVNYPGLGQVSTFLADNPGFELPAANLEAFTADANLSRVGDRKALTGALGGLQALNRLGASWEEAGALLNDGVDSSMALAAHGRERLHERFAGRIRTHRLDEIEGRAVALQDSGLVYMATTPRFSGSSIEVLPAPTSVADTAVLADRPTLRSLFGDLDTCACAHCESVLSPAAYLVDLLEFLRPKPAAFQRLIDRRSDLVDLELSCVNTEAELPYIDLVVEILENAVALPLDVPLPGGVTVSEALTADPLHPKIVSKLKETALTVSDSLQVSLEDDSLRPGPATPWVVVEVDGHKRWTLQEIQECMTVQEPGEAEVRLTLAGADLSAAVTALADGHLPAALRQQLDEKLGRRNARVVTPTMFDVRLDISQPGLEWTLEYALGVRVKIDLAAGGANGILTLLTEDDREIVSRTYSSDFLRQGAARLDAGAADGPLEAFIPGWETATVTVDTPGSRWRIIGAERSAALRYASERLAIASLAYQSSSTTQDLMAVPANRNPAAYDILKAAGFPWSLPFDLTLAEVRGYLERAGVSRLALMELLAPSVRLTDPALIRERLGLSEAETTELTQPASDDERWKQWGLTVVGGIAYTRDPGRDEDVSGAPLELLRRASVLLGQARLEWNELLDLLETTGLTSVRTVPETECQPSKIVLDGLGPDQLDQIRVFTRLRRGLGWSIQELDIALVALDPGQPTGDTCLKPLSHLVRLRERLGLSVEELSSWWGGLGTREYNVHTSDEAGPRIPLYDRLFLNAAITNPPDPDFALNDDRTKLRVEDHPPAVPLTITAKRPSVAAALGIRQDELASLLSEPLPTGVADAFTLANLARLNAIAGLTRALALSIEDYLKSLRLTSAQPFKTTEDAVSFCDTIGFIQNSGFTIQDLEFVLGAEADAGSTLPLTDEQVADILKDLRAVALATPLTAPPPPDPSASARADAIVGAAAEHFAIDRELSSVLLRNRLKQPSHPAVAAIAVFLDDAFVTSSDSPTDAAPFKDAFAVIRRLHRVAMVCTRLRLTGPQLSWLRAPGFDVLDFDAIPIAAPVADLGVLVDGWRRLITLVQIRDQLPNGSAFLSNYADEIRAPNPVLPPEVLTTALTLSTEEVKAAAARIGLVATGDYRDPLKVRDLLAVVTVMQRLGGTWAQVSALAASSPNEKASDIVRQLLRAKLGDERWRDVIRPVEDRLREQQRDALVDHRIAREQLRDSNDLYAYYLLDVEMAPCMKTTRIVQAIGSMQQFIQRCFLRLEDGISAFTLDRARWEWIDRYRVWEAGRKVFLYPENWLFPELREDKTQIFSELEGALGQDEATPENTRAALLTYLDQLGELAQVIVLGMYEDTTDVDGVTQRTLYVVGRSPNIPSSYYWRTCTNFGEDGMAWTGWEHLDQDISGDHVLPFVFEGDPHIAWPVARKIQDSDEEYWDIRLAWSRRTTKGWTKRQLTATALPRMPALHTTNGRDETEGLAFRLDRQTLPQSIIVAETAPGAEQPLIPSELVRIKCYVAGDPAPTSSPDPYTRPHTEVVPNASPSATASIGVYRKRVNEQRQPAAGATVAVAIDDPGAQVVGLPFLTGITGASGTVLTQAVPLLKTAYKLTLTVSLDGAQIVQSGGGLDIQAPGGAAMIVGDVEFLDPTSDPSATVPIADGVFVPMNLVGEFQLSTSNDTVVASLDGGRLRRYPGTVFHGSGYREEAPGDQTFVLSAASDGTAFTPLFARTPGRFTTIPASPPKALGPIWNYRDDSGRYYIRAEPAPPANGQTLGLDGGGGATIQAGGGSSPYPKANPELLVFSDDLIALPLLRQIAGRDLGAMYAPALQAVSDGNKGFNAHSPTTDYTLAGESLTLQGPVFDQRSPNGIYNWEAFLHIPLLVGQYLMKEQRFDDAKQWLEYVFNPAADDAADGSTWPWRFLPFRLATSGTSLQQLFEWLADPDTNPPEEAAFRNDILRWRANPFRPDAVARTRPRSYQWRAVFDYLDLLLGWGDQLFRLDSRESINEATQLYILAANILGPRPLSTSQSAKSSPLSYRALYGKWDEFANAWRSITSIPAVGSNSNRTQNLGGAPGVHSLGMLYFCIPPNEQLLGYWDLVEDRLFKIRHCRNIEGQERELPLFDPPIDPEILVRAVAAGVDIESVLADLAAPAPLYRFNVLLAKASEMCAEVRALGSALLTALEKQDAEHLALLRSSNEIELLNLVTSVKTQQIAESERTLDALRLSRRNTGDRYSHYQHLLGNTSAQVPPEGTVLQPTSIAGQVVPSDSLWDAERGLGLVQSEVDQLRRLGEAQILGIIAGVHNVNAGLSFASAIFPWLVQIGPAFGHMWNAGASAFQAGATSQSQWATKDAILAGYQRRRDEWLFQSNLAVRELEQLDQQIAAVLIRGAILQAELSNHERQIELTQSVDDFMKEKYSTEALYQWTAGQLSGVYFRAYQLAYGLAKKAERAFQLEIAPEEKTTFVQPGYWDSLKKGLLAGERLHYDLKRMDAAYLDRNKREYEITKHISLLQLDPLQLLLLKETKNCEIRLPEALFDLDFPGHYMRRIKAVALSIPCVTGPYAGVPCTLTLNQHWIRHSPTLDPGDPFVSTESIVTSSAQNDTGLFETNLRDERYLPFEDAGVDSAWELELPSEFAQFDRETISDVVVHLRYTARDGGKTLRDNASAALTAALKGSAALGTGQPLRRLVSIRHEYPSEWARLTAQGAAARVEQFTFARNTFPYLFQDPKFTITIIGVVLGGIDMEAAPATLPSLAYTLPTPNNPSHAVTFDTPPKVAGALTYATSAQLSVSVDSGVAWTITAGADVTGLQDLLILLAYQVKSPPNGG